MDAHEGPDGGDAVAGGVAELLVIADRARRNAEGIAAAATTDPRGEELEHEAAAMFSLLEDLLGPVLVAARRFDLLARELVPDYDGATPTGGRRRVERRRR